MSAILELDEQNFEKEVEKSAVPVLVDFWAPWCSPCKMLAPVLHEIASEANGKFKIAKVNIDGNAQIANRYNVMNIPTMILFNAGEEVDRMVGYMPKAKILAKIKNIL